MRGLHVAALILLLAGCESEASEPKSMIERLEAGNLSDEDLQTVMSGLPGMTPSCIARIRERGISAFPEKTEDCFQMTPQARWTGLWRADFEGSMFCADRPDKEATECSYEEGVRGTWFEPNMDYTPDGSLYRVEFIGRRTVHPGRFGHMGVFEHEMIVDRMIAMEQVEAPPPPLTKEQPDALWKECEAAGSCISWEKLEEIPKGKD